MFITVTSRLHAVFRVLSVANALIYVQEILVDRAVHAAVSRFLPSSITNRDTQPILLKEDFSVAMHEFIPVAMRGLTKAASEGGRSGWDDVGGLADIRNAIQEVCMVSILFSLFFFFVILDYRLKLVLGSWECNFHGSFLVLNTFWCINIIFLSLVLSVILSLA